jgi:hypothetical protein
MLAVFARWALLPFLHSILLLVCCLLAFSHSDVTAEFPYVLFPLDRSYLLC